MNILGKPYEVRMTKDEERARKGIENEQFYAGAVGV